MCSPKLWTALFPACLAVACHDPADDQPVSDVSGTWGPAPILDLTQQPGGELSGMIRETETSPAVVVSGRIDASVLRVSAADGSIELDAHVWSHFSMNGSFLDSNGDREAVGLERTSPVPSDVDLASLAGMYDVKIISASEDSPVSTGSTRTSRIVLMKSPDQPLWAGVLENDFLNYYPIGIFYARRGRMLLVGDDYVDLSVDPPILHFSHTPGRGLAVHLQAEMVRRVSE